MSTDNKTVDKLQYTEGILNMTDPRFLSEAESFRFEKRRTPASTWIAAACFALIFAAALLIMLKPMGERPIGITQPTAEPTERLIFSPGNEFPDYGADVLEKYDAIVLEYPNGNPYSTGDSAKPLAAKLLLPKGWTVKDGKFDGLGYYPNDEFASYCMPERTGNAVKSIYSESGECVGSIGLAATTAEYPGIVNAFAPVTMGNGAFRFTDDKTANVSSGKNGEAYIGRAQYAQKLAEPDSRQSIELPVLISYDKEYLVGLVMEFGANAVSDEQLIQIAESVRFALLNSAAPEQASERPIPYNREEYDTLLAFFELADENGVKNGEKCFKNYDPNQINFWGEDPEEDAEESRLIWEDGKLSSIILEGLSDETKLVGSIRLDKFGSLKEFSANRMIFESFNGDLRNSFNAIDASDEYLMFGCEGENVLIADFITVFHVASFSHCRYESTDEKHDGKLAFTADLNSDGNGHVGIRGHMDMHYYIVDVYAEPKEGYEFIGWYDAEGSLISTEETIEISYIDENGTGVRSFTGIARFAPAGEPPLEEEHARLTFINGLDEELTELGFIIDGDFVDKMKRENPETVTRFDLHQYWLNECSIVAGVSAKRQDGSDITRKYILPYFEYKHGDVIELKEEGETALATVTRGSGDSYELPVISYEYEEGHLLPMSDELLHPVVADTSGKCSEFGTDYDDRIYIGTEYGKITLNESETAKYPSLARALEARNTRIEAELAEAHDRMLADTSKYRTQELFRAVSAIRRADSMVLSFIGCESIEHNDELHSRIYSSENYETATGRLLTLSDVVTDASSLASILNAKLEKGDTAFRFDPAKHFSAPSADFAWTLDHDGLFFIINENRSSLYVPFIEHEGLVKAEYMPVSENYMVQLVDSVENWFTVNGKAESTATYAQQLEAVKAGLDDDGNPLAFIHAGGRDYLLMDGQRYIWGESSNLLLFGNGFACRMYNGFDWIFRGFKTENLGSVNYIDALLANGCNTDPGSITATTDVMAIGYHWGAASKFALNDDGRFVRIDEYYEADFERTLLKEYTVDEIDLDGNTIGTITLGAGETVRVFRFNYGFEDARTADGRIVRLTLPGDDESGLIYYEQVWAIFGEGIDLGP